MIFRGRSSLLWLLAPAVVFLAPLPWINHPHVLAPWLFGSVLLTPVFVHLAARGDPLFGDDGRRGGGGDQQ